MKIGFCKGASSTYGVIDHLQAELMAGVASTETEIVECLNLEDARGLDAFYFSNFLRTDFQKDLDSHVNVLFNFLLDAPFHHAAWILTSPPSVIYGVVDPSHIGFLHLMNRKGVFFPLGGTVHPLQPWDSRDIDVLFTGTAPNLNLWEGKINDLPGDLPAIAHMLVKSYFLNPTEPLITHFSLLIQALNIKLQPADTVSILKLTDLYIRARCRMDLIKAFRDFSVVLVGTGWDSIEMSPHHRWLGEVPHSQNAELMCRAKIVLCPNSGFVQGTQDRILDALGSGAVPLTMPTPYLQASLVHGEHLAYFTSMEEAVHWGQHILGDSTWQTVAARGREVVEQQHSWYHRGRNLVQIIHNRSAFALAACP